MSRSERDRMLEAWRVHQPRAGEPAYLSCFEAAWAACLAARANDIPKVNRTLGGAIGDPTPSQREIDKGRR